MESMPHIDGLLLFLFVFGPIVSKTFFFSSSKSYSIAHSLSLAIVVLGYFTHMPVLFLIWPLFCIFGLGLHARNQFREGVLGPNMIHAFFPFVFSVVSAIWFIAGSFDLHLLGYGRLWSYFASLHSGFLGWTFISCVSFASIRKGKNSAKSNVFRIGSWMCTIAFFLVAFGIYRFPVLKAIGTVCFSILMSVLIGWYFLQVKKTRSWSTFFVGLSFIFIIVAMLLAVCYEFSFAIFGQTMSTSKMIIYHGCLNAFIVIPSYFIAIYLNRIE